MANYILQHKKHFNFKSFVQNALQEDVGDGDHSALATIPANKKGKCHL
jgi:nicotinate-nucleotide pyrophosphorylase (carboxylating)